MSQCASATTRPQVPAPQQLQYLEAMGITAWTARYRLPHAAETAACEWPDAAPAVVSEPPVQRLHSLLDDASAVTAAPPVQVATPEPRAPSVGRMRALLDTAEAATVADDAELSTPHSVSAVTDLSTPPVAATTPTVQEALRFTLQVTALDERWLIILVQPKSPTATEQRLLKAMWTAVGIEADHVEPFIDFQWPMIEGLVVESPVIEAQQGIKAFLDGRARAGLVPQRLVVFGNDDEASMKALSQVLALDDKEHSTLLSLPVWQAPSLSTLLESSAHKAALWPHLQALGQLWRKEHAKPSEEGSA